MDKVQRVGIVGASASGGWAKMSHVPAVQRLTELELSAVAGSSQKSADKSAEAFGAKQAFGDALALVRDPDVDLVSVCVKVPDHRELVLAAIEAGKAIYCEWPLGRDLAETRELADAAEKAGVHAAIGLQARQNPAVRRAVELLAGGAVGRVLCARVHSTAAAFGPEVGESSLYLEDAANGATLLTIQGGHTLDLTAALLGGLADAGGLLSRQYPQIEVGDAKEKRPRMIHDHVLAQARSSDGAPACVEVAGGRPTGETPFRLEITGDQATLALVGGAAPGFQAGRLTLTLDGEPQDVDEGETAALPDAAVNVAGVYALLRDDIADGTRRAPDFAHAVRLTRLIGDVAESSASGRRAEAGDWPRP